VFLNVNKENPSLSALDKHRFKKNWLSRGGNNNNNNNNNNNIAGTCN
jgi:hypothetical protein